MGGGAGREAAAAAASAAALEEKLKVQAAALEAERVRAERAESDARARAEAFETESQKVAALGRERSDLAEEVAGLKSKVAQLEGKVRAFNDEDTDDGDDGLGGGGGDLAEGELADDEPSSNGVRLLDLVRFFREHVGDVELVERRCGGAGRCGGGRGDGSDHGAVRGADTDSRPLCRADKLATKCAEWNRQRAGKVALGDPMPRFMRPDAYAVTRLIVRPMTRKTRGSLARVWAPEGVQAEVFVSHAWCEDIADVLQGLLSFARGRAGGRRPGEAAAACEERILALPVYIAAFSESQWPERGHGTQGAVEPTFPLRCTRVFRDAAVATHLCSLGRNAETLSRAWCSLELWEAVHAGKRIVVTSRFGPVTDVPLEGDCGGVADLPWSSVLSAALHADPGKAPAGSEAEARAIRRRAAEIAGDGALAAAARSAVATLLLPLLARLDATGDVRAALAAAATPDAEDSRHIRALTHAAAWHGEACGAAAVLLEGRADASAADGAGDVIAMFSAKDAKLREAAMEAVRGRAVHAGALAAAEEEHAEKVAAMELPRLRDPSAACRLEAAKRLASLGAHGSSYAGEMARLMEDADPHVRDAALEAAGRLGNLSQMLSDSSPQVRSAALRGVAASGIAASRHAATIAAALGDDDWSVRHAAVNALAQLGEGAAPYVGDVVLRLADEQWYVRLAALRLLEKHGRVAAPYVHAVAECLGDPQREVRQAASAALGRIQPAGSSPDASAGMVGQGPAASARI